jgi:hypothetical protein
MSTNVSHPVEDGRGHVLSRRNEYWRGVLYGTIPLALLVVITAVAFALAVLVHQLMDVTGFFVQQQAVLIILGCGLVLALVAFTIAVVFIMRRVAIWQQAGRVERTRAALWTLTASALVILLPLILAIILPQHPAP